MFSHEVWAVCEPRSVQARQWTNNEEEKRDHESPDDGRWRHIVCRMGCEIALADDDAFFRGLAYMVTPGGMKYVATS
jgi:hypothetical protein